MQNRSYTLKVSLFCVSSNCAELYFYTRQLGYLHEAIVGIFRHQFIVIYFPAY